MIDYSATHPCSNQLKLEVIDDLERTINTFRFLPDKQMIEIAKQKRIGNCQQYSALVYDEIKKLQPEFAIEEYVINNQDHQFVVIGRDSHSNPQDFTTWGPRAVIVDAWAGAVYPAAEIPQKLRVSADTIVVADGRILGKPRDRAEARRMLSRLAGREHRVYTAICLLCRERGFRDLGTEVTRVRFRPLAGGGGRRLRPHGGVRRQGGGVRGAGGGNAAHRPGHRVVLERGGPSDDPRRGDARAGAGDPRHAQRPGLVRLRGRSPMSSRGVSGRGCAARGSGGVGAGPDRGRRAAVGEGVFRPRKREAWQLLQI